MMSDLFLLKAWLTPSSAVVAAGQRATAVRQPKGSPDNGKLGTEIGRGLPWFTLPKFNIDTKNDGFLDVPPFNHGYFVPC